MTNLESVWIKEQHSSSSGPREDWQALFACQIRIRPFEERIKLKWGFSAAFLLEEALDRQKLFIESQYANNPIQEQTAQRILAFRCISAPNSGMILSLIGKVQATSQEEANQGAVSYCKELCSVFPYDYVLQPATSEAEFLRLSGDEILAQCQDRDAIAKIRRFESPLQTLKGQLYMTGLWQTSLRSDEQIWRALANFPHPTLLNVALSPTILSESERQTLWAMSQKIHEPHKPPNEKPLLPYETWAEPFISRRISPWKKFFFLQVHLATTTRLEEYLIRAVGSSITRDNPTQTTPGYQEIRPSDNHQAKKWSENLSTLSLSSEGNTMFARLNELADLDETHAVFRFPYPPELGFPGVTFIETI